MSINTRPSVTPANRTERENKLNVISLDTAMNVLSNHRLLLKWKEVLSLKYLRMEANKKVIDVNNAFSPLSFIAFLNFGFSLSIFLAQEKQMDEIPANMAKQ